ncbi:MAG: hypothetical protein LUQ16_00870 [Methanomassiliicoccales archaeon]|nr:hypothetical protein [Methanomassiliicoccales archaeon]MDD1755613.1 hypothetical protein [Methanomassiliicoccales archaeon]
MCFLIIHTWKKEDFKVVGRKVIEAMPGAPKGSNMISSYVDSRLTGAWCIWDTENPEEVKKYLAKVVPEMHTADIIPILQFVPPGTDSYKIMHTLASL